MLQCGVEPAAVIAALESTEATGGGRDAGDVRVAEVAGDGVGAGAAGEGAGAAMGLLAQAVQPGGGGVALVLAGEAAAGEEVGGGAVGGGTVADGLVSALSTVVQSHLYSQLCYDIRYALNHPPIAKGLFEEASLFPLLLRSLALLQGMHPIRRAVRRHVEHEEGSWADAFSLCTEVAHLFPCIVSGLPTHAADGSSSPQPAVRYATAVRSISVVLTEWLIKHAGCVGWNRTWWRASAGIEIGDEGLTLWGLTAAIIVRCGIERCPAAAPC